MQLSNDLKHEVFAFAEDIADALAPRTDAKHGQIVGKIKNRLERFAAAILEQAKKATP